MRSSKTATPCPTDVASEPIIRRYNARCCKGKTRRVPEVSAATPRKTRRSSAPRLASCTRRSPFDGHAAHQPQPIPERAPLACAALITPSPCYIILPIASPQHVMCSASSISYRQNAEDSGRSTSAHRTCMSRLSDKPMRGATERAPPPPGLQQQHKSNSPRRQKGQPTAANAARPKGTTDRPLPVGNI